MTDVSVDDSVRERCNQPSKAAMPPHVLLRITVKFDGYTETMEREQGICHLLIDVLSLINDNLVAI